MINALKSDDGPAQPQARNLIPNLIMTDIFTEISRMEGFGAFVMAGVVGEKAERVLLPHQRSSSSE
jgi:hypothetical protein